MKTPNLCSAALLVLLLLLVSGIQSASSHKDGAEPRCAQTAFSVLVTDSVTPTPNKTYSTYVCSGGILLGGLRRLYYTTDFTFIYTDFQEYGPFLQSVNGIEGSKKERTFWQLLVRQGQNVTKTLEVGIGVYIPKENDLIILKYTQY